MARVVNFVISLLMKLLPQEYLYSTKLLIIKLALSCLVIGFISSYLINFLVKIIYKRVKHKMKELKRIKRLSSVKVKNGIFVGEVTQFLGKIGVVVIRVDKKQVKIGDTILIKGSQTKILQKVESMQINHQPVEVVKKGQEAGIVINQSARTGDLVF